MAMITAIIQARMGSTRLPRKVLLPLGDTTILGSTVRQVRSATKIGKVVVATSDQVEDDPIAAECEKLGVEVFRGSLEDVIDRYYKAAKHFGAEHICRATADCPLIDPSVLDRVAMAYESERPDYISTGRIDSTFPDGMDTEIFSFAALERAWKEAKLTSEREHVTPYIWKHPELFIVREVKNDRDYSKIRLTIDEPADYEVVKEIAARVMPLSMTNIIEYLFSHPDTAERNASIVRDAGYLKSIQEESHTA